MSAGAPWIVRMEYVEPKKRRRKATPKITLPKFEVILGERLRDPLELLLEEAARRPYQLPLGLPPKSTTQHELTQREAASMGGRARARSMTKQERSASARAAALKRWEKRRRENSGVVAHDAAAPSEDEARRR